MGYGELPRAGWWLFSGWHNMLLLPPRSTDEKPSKREEGATGGFARRRAGGHGPRRAGSRSAGRGNARRAVGARGEGTVGAWSLSLLFSTAGTSKRAALDTRGFS